MDEAAYRERLLALARLRHSAEHDEGTGRGALGFRRWTEGVYALRDEGHPL